MVQSRPPSLRPLSSASAASGAPPHLRPPSSRTLPGLDSGSAEEVEEAALEEDDDAFVYVYVREEQAHLLVEMARAEVAAAARAGYDPQVLVRAVPSHCTPRPVKLVRMPEYSPAAPDGDALSGFSKSSEACGVIARFSARPPRPGATADELEQHAFTARGAALVLPTLGPRQDRQLATLRRHVIVPRWSLREARLRQREDPYVWLSRVQLPRYQPWLDAVADKVGEFNEALAPGAGLPLVPYLRDTLVPLAAATSIQAAWRAHRCRQNTQPAMTARVLARRAALTLQRGFRMHLLRSRLHMLARCKALCEQPFRRVMALTQPSWEAFSDHVQSEIPPPAFLPEQQLQFAFAESDVSSVFLITPHELFKNFLARCPIPLWVGLDLPSTSQAAVAALKETPSVYGREEVLPLLEQDVEGAVVQFSAARSSLPPHLKPYKHFQFKSPEDARQRCGLLYLLTYDIKRKTGVELVVDELAPSDSDLAAGEEAQALGQRTAHADAQRALGWAAKLTIPPRLVRALPPHHRLLRYKDLPQHLQPRFVTKPPTQVEYDAKLGERETRDYIAQRLDSLAHPPPLPERPSTPRQRLQHLHSTVAAAMARLLHKSRPALARERAFGTVSKNQQAMLIRDETERLLKERIKKDVSNELQRREAIRQHMHELDLMLRSTNTASGTQVQGREDIAPGAVSELAVLLREEVTRIHKAKAAEARSQSKLAKLVVADEKLRKRGAVYEARTAGHHARMQAIHSSQLADEEEKMRQIQRRKWQLQRKQYMEHNRRFIRAFACQHNALSKQMVNAEIAHLHGMDWHYTCREVDERRRAEQLRKQEVEEDQELSKKLQRELWLEKAAQTALAREELLLEVDEERQGARDRADASRAQHEMYAPKHGQIERIPPRRARKPIKLTSIVSAT